VWSILSAIVEGAIIGALGQLVVPGKQNLKLWVTVAIGIVAALVGNGISAVLGVRDTDGIDWIRHIIQVALAAIGVSYAAGRGIGTRGTGRRTA
jgi:uncharacterized membrane protein YeaQ/YmgE (transglycosylase-associated protein family)